LDELISELAQAKRISTVFGMYPHLSVGVLIHFASVGIYIGAFHHLIPTKFGQVIGYFVPTFNFVRQFSKSVRYIFHHYV